ncbi:hypothetical protein LINGRAHAP2_LOCUS4842, partial [Linum grandiflorum]
LPPNHPSSSLILFFLFSILLLLLPLRPQRTTAAAPPAVVDARFLLSLGDSDDGGREATTASILFLSLWRIETGNTRLRSSPAR